MLNGPCICAIHFVNGTRHIIVKPEAADDQDFQDLKAEFPEAFASAEIGPALSVPDTNALWSKYPNDVQLRFEDPDDPNTEEFKLPYVPREQTAEGIDITP
jgi:hypothetical protein